MVKPLWALTGIALLGTAGVVGAVVVASSGSEEEVVQQVETPKPSASVSATGVPEAPPTRTPGARETLWRWANVTVSVPEDSSITISRGGSAPPTLELTLGEASYVIIDGSDGQILDDQVRPEDRSVLDEILKTITVSPLDPLTAPWPYNGDPPATLREERIGNLVYMHPEPASGIQIGFGVAEGGIGEFIEVGNGRSFMFIQASTGKVLGTDRIQPEDQELFAKYADAVVHCSDTSAC